MPENYVELQVRFTVTNSVNLVVEIQDQGFTEHTTVSPLQFEITYNDLRLSLSFNS